MNRRRVIIIGTVALIIIVASVAVLVIHRKSTGYMGIGTEFQDDADRMGIDYGGSFDEFNYNPEDDTDKEGGDIDEEQAEFDYEYYMNTTPDELKAELRRQREEARDTIEKGGSEQTNAPNGGESIFDDDFIDDDFEEAGEGVDISELGIAVIESTGYAQDEVLCNTESKEEAENVAAQISGTLLSWEHGVAVIKIEGSVDEFLEKLEQQGSNLNLYRNFYY